MNLALVSFTYNLSFEFLFDSLLNMHVIMCICIVKLIKKVLFFLQCGSNQRLEQIRMKTDTCNYCLSFSYIYFDVGLMKFN